jgi:hypothetical protein
MTFESQNKSLARRFLEEVVNTGAVDRLSDFLAPEYVAPDVGIAGIDQARDHLLNSLEALLELGVVRWASDLGAAGPAQAGALPNGGPATSVGNSEVTPGPPRRPDC